MNFLEAARTVGTPIALIAFIIACAATLYLWKIRIDAQKTKDARGDTAALSILLETYSIKDDNLTRGQKFDLMMEVLRQKATRFRYVVYISGILVVILGLLAAYAFHILARPSPPDPLPIPSPTPVPGRPISGIWDVIVACPDGLAINEYASMFSEGRFTRPFVTPAKVRGFVELVAGKTDAESISVRGVLVFENTPPYKIDGQAKLVGGVFGGTAVLGNETGCTLTINPSHDVPPNPPSTLSRLS